MTIQNDRGEEATCSQMTEQAVGGHGRVLN